jgi:hypothetical protein
MDDTTLVVVWGAAMIFTGAVFKPWGFAEIGFSLGDGLVSASRDETGTRDECLQLLFVP